MKTERDTAEKIVKLLDESAAALDHKVVDRLHQARMKAVATLSERRQSAVAVGGGGVLQLLGGYIERHRIVMPAVMLCSAAAVAFVLAQQMVMPVAAEQGDAYLLAAELPPEAFLDKGFDTWVAQHTLQQ